MKVSIVNKSCFSLPKYETIGSAGMDLRADLTRCDYSEIESNSDVITLKLESRKVYMIPTGLFISLPQSVSEVHTGEGYGHEAQIRARSGLSSKGVMISNGIGTVDEDFRGELRILLTNLNEEDFTIKHGDRIAQMVINRYEKISWEDVNELDITDRGEGGFGSTGK